MFLESAREAVDSTRMGENIYKLHIPKGANPQNIQETHMHQSKSTAQITEFYNGQRQLNRYFAIKTYRHPSTVQSGVTNFQRNVIEISHMLSKKGEI